MQNLRALSTFVSIVSAGNFSKAANNLGITPQAVSLHVKQLEELVGVRLINRSTRGISLTDEGARFYKTCSAAIDAIDNDVRALRDSREKAFGNIRVGAPYGFGWRYVAPAIGKFRELHPEVSVELVIQNRVPDLLSESIDLVVLADPLTERSIVARKFCTMRSMLCASPQYLEKFGIPQDVEDLAQHRCINLKNWVDGRILPWRFRVGDEIFTRQFHSDFVTDDGDCALQAVLSGAGIAQLAGYRIQPHLASGALKTVLTSHTFEYSFYLCMLSRTLIPKRIRVMADFLFNELKSHPELRVSY
jgi:LysR family transcriptional regulator for bpeEF and oprC